ncbi:acetoacetate decarboxylase family protein [Nocardioides sp. R-C-SC26]|uniref:acetoacetate decarboxylase family protein n=1 Tax=Nocardioides sp. R-C-SC26 TaxID=2870414 RepID=UPI001E574C51|nr:acetoacetate decarboxylase family protein [Nocardioides sp. R-C-SC26]
MTESVDLPYERVAYPATPWDMVGSLWLTVFKLKRDVDATRPAGIYGAAFVSYEEGSPLTYGELLVARATRADEGHDKAVTITDIWVDSPASVAGGRELWAIPKWLCDFDYESVRRGPVTTSSWSASLDRAPIASARFTDVSRVAPRIPFKGDVWQPELPEGGGEKRAVMSGNAKALPARARWEFAPDGPLAFMREARQLASFRQTDFRLRFH